MMLQVQSMVGWILVNFFVHLLNKGDPNSTVNTSVIVESSPILVCNWDYILFTGKFLNVNACGLS